MICCFVTSTTKNISKLVGAGRFIGPLSLRYSNFYSPLRDKEDIEYIVSK
jgi:hypothetical protein